MMIVAAQSNDILRKLWAPRPFMAAGRFTRETALERAEATGDLIAFGRRFLANVRKKRPMPENRPFNTERFETA